MDKDLKNIRRDYTKGQLLENEIEANPIAQFSNWYSESHISPEGDPTAMILSTVDQSGMPDGRVVLLKEVLEGKFVFYTNYNSKKGKDLAVNPKACLTFFWPDQERQIRIRGVVEKVPSDMSDTYFNSRPRESQVGGLVSPQSAEIPNREFLEEKFASANKSNDPISRPDHWGGYWLIPEEIEFWQGRASRLHDRILYTLIDNQWKVDRLAP